MNQKIWLCLAHMSGNEQKFINEAFETNWVVPLGPNVNAFEEELKESLQGDTQADPIEVVALSSGTAAIHIALTMLGVGPGDEVICQSFTFAASANPIAYLGAVPVFVDSEAETWNMDPTLLEEAINDRYLVTGHYPKAIIPVYLYGMPPKMDEILAIAKKYNIPVVEDSTEAQGTLYKGKAAGTLGHFGSMSFNGNKMITTSGGGALICKNVEEKQQAIYYATQARQPKPYYEHTVIGYNYRLSNVSAGIGRGQMTVLKDHVAHHRMVHKLYMEGLNPIEGLRVQNAPNADFDSSYWLSTLLIDQEKFGCEPSDLMEALSLEGIESRPLWNPMHNQPVFKNAPSYTNGVSDGLFKIGLCLPSGPMVSKEDVLRIIEVIRNFKK